MKPVLILGDEPRIVVNIARSLHRRGVPVDVASLSSEAPPVHSNAIRRFTVLPDLNGEPTFCRDVLLDRIEAHHYDYLVPASDTALAFVAGHYAALSKMLHVASPPPTIVDRVLNKWHTLQWAQACDVPIPNSLAISSLADLAERGPSLTFPVIAKPRAKGQGDTGTFKTRRFESLEELEQAWTQNPSFGMQNLIQEYCPGEGVGIEVLMHDARPLVLFQHRRLKELPRTGGVSVLAVAEPVDPRLRDHAVRLLRAMQWEGVAMVEFRADRSTGQVALMEVNGRYWGSLGLSIMAGVDFPWYEWQLAHGHTPDIPNHYRKGIAARWTSGAIQRLSTSLGADAQGPAARGRGIVREMIGFAHDCLPPTRDLLWSLDDPRPGLHESVTALRTLARETMKRMLTPLVPTSLLSLRRQSRILDTRARRMYLWMALRRALKIKRDRVPSRWPGIKSVLFVCHGNILRSPMAAALLAQAADARGHRVEVYSAGLHANPFKKADPRGIAVAAEVGVALTSHRAEPLTRDMVQRADLIFVMDRFNEAELLARYPQAGRKLFCLSLCGPAQSDCLDIQDPYRGAIDDIRQCYHKIQVCISGLLVRLAGEVDETRSMCAGSSGQPTVRSTAEPVCAEHVRS